MTATTTRRAAAAIGVGAALLLSGCGHNEMVTPPGPAPTLENVADSSVCVSGGVSFSETLCQRATAAAQSRYEAELYRYQHTEVRTPGVAERFGPYAAWALVLIPAWWYLRKVFAGMGRPLAAAAMGNIAAAEDELQLAEAVEDAVARGMSPRDAKAMANVLRLQMAERRTAGDADADADDADDYDDYVAENSGKKKGKKGKADPNAAPPAQPSVLAGLLAQQKNAGK